MSEDQSSFGLIYEFGGYEFIRCSPRTVRFLFNGRHVCKTSSYGRALKYAMDEFDTDETPLEAPAK